MTRQVNNKFSGSKDYESELVKIFLLELKKNMSSIYYIVIIIVTLTF